MNESFLRIQAHCLAKRDTYEDYPWGETVWKLKPKGKVFCFGGTTSITVRATLDEQTALITLPGITPAPYLARHGWVAIDLELSENIELILDLIDRSYDLVKTGPKAKR